MAGVPDVQQPGYRDVQPLKWLTFQTPSNLDTWIGDDQNAEHPGDPDGMQSGRPGPGRVKNHDEESVWTSTPATPHEDW
jgi:hypothetical protein